MSSIFNKIQKRILRPYFRKIMGWKNIEERFTAIEYMINNYFDISAFPKATGLLRKCQLVDTELLRIVCETLDKHNLPYWLDYGTLLGAVRHKGFIPWDDDLDICMTREHYDIAAQILPKELKKYDIYVQEPDIKCIAMSIWKAGAILDIFPMDNVEKSTVSNHDELRNKYIEYEKFYENNNKLSNSELLSAKSKIIGAPSQNNPLWYHNPEFCKDRTIYDNDTIFPLKTIQFEGYTFYAPNDCHKYLTETYGDYMSFPKNGILHHNLDNKNNITNNSIEYGLDMDKFLEEIKEIKIQ